MRRYGQAPSPAPAAGYNPPYQGTTFPFCFDVVARGLCVIVRNTRLQEATLIFLLIRTLHRAMVFRHVTCRCSRPLLMRGRAITVPLMRQARCIYFSRFSALFCFCSHRLLCRLAVDPGGNAVHTQVPMQMARGLSLKLRGLPYVHDDSRYDVMIVDMT